MVYTLRFFLSSKCSLFHNSNVFGSCIIHILYTGRAKIKKKKNSGTKRLNDMVRSDIICPFHQVLLDRLPEDRRSVLAVWQIGPMGL